MLVKEMRSDIVVAGGGMSGVISAIAAAREGNNVILIEKNYCLGGNATAGMLGEINGVYYNGEPIVSTIGKEIISDLRNKNAICHARNRPMTSDPNIRVDRLEYNGEYLKLVLDNFVKEEKIKVIFCSNIKNIENNIDFVNITLANTYGEINITCRVLIDATGNAECFYMLNGKTLIPDKDNLQAVSVLFRLGGANTHVYRNINNAEIQRIIARGIKEKVLPARILSIVVVPNTSDIIINCTRCCGINHESMEEISEAMITLRQQINDIIPFIKRNVPGCENVFLSSIASSLGVRDRRRVDGVYELTGKDVIHGKKFEDSVAVGCYPVDIHKGNESCHAVEFVKIKDDGMYRIPYRAMITEDISNVIASGKCISVDDIAFGAIRAIGTIMNIGTAAGVAASLAILYDSSVQSIEIEKLRDLLIEKYQMLGIRM